MERAEARALAVRLMREHGLDEWTFGWDRARRRAGCCHHTNRRITLSAPLTVLYDEETVRQVILHEIAHALVGPRHQHDRVWRAKARSLGVTGSARLPSALPKPEAPWVGTCPSCGARRELYGPPRRVTSCGMCARDFRVDRILEWRFRGEPRTPEGAYARELRRIRRATPRPR